MDEQFDIFCVTVPGMEGTLLAECLAAGFDTATQTAGGVTLTGGWTDVWRANLVLRGATRILARIGSFRAFHLAQLDKRARKFPWRDTLRPDLPVRVDVTTRASKIYIAKAAAQRIETALREDAGITVDPEAEITLKVRIDDNLCTFSIDTSGAPLHIRGHKEAVNKAPMRENLAALFLRQCGYDGTEPVLDPMCGSGTFVIEAAEIARGLHPGRTRSFAFENLANFDQARWDFMRSTGVRTQTQQQFYGSDRDAGATRMSLANAERAGVADLCQFQTHAISDLQRPEGPPGLVIVNPPYGGRIGNKNLLYGLYAALGTTLKERFSGWRVGIITSENGLAKATGLPFKPTTGPVPHGGIRVTLFQTGVLDT
ncbi:THUMP domain-containing class I SAM-dependent RNA methyltransferase [Yoonia sp. 208BN28-4]|uniref:THUMP domain-containing class I SAM-dependent RNA methyltransferase n=1 Tax=Yoonia sp. 208BN28-4 TaxID=3126505 RepID=UPI0030B6359D